MNKKVPGIIVTGASGFIGRHFVIAVSKQFRLFCLARRSQKEAGIPFDDNIKWLQADISKWQDLLNVIKYVKEHGGADYVLHLAGYYDFTMDDNPAYEKTNVTGTRYVLNMSQLLGIKHLIFSSSLLACKFPPYNQVLTEESPADENFPYARSKRQAEKTIRDYSGIVPSSILRLAAVYSDWCEYPPLYFLLKTWLSKNNMMARCLGGKGETAVPYIHVKDLIRLFTRIFDISDTLPKTAVYIASPRGSVSHKDLFSTATRYYYGRDITPVKIPKFITGPGLIVRSFFWGLIGEKPFEQPWMVRFIDLKLNVDPTHTYKTLGWEPRPRHHILRRLLFLTERMINHPNNWKFRNEAMLRRVATRQSTTIFDVLGEIRETVIENILYEFIEPGNSSLFYNYQKMDRHLLKWYITLIYQLIAVTVRSRDRSLVNTYAQIIASRRFAEGFKPQELKIFLKTVGKHITGALLERHELKEQRVYDYIDLTIQYTIDEIEDTYEILETQPPERLPAIKTVDDLAGSEDIKRIVRQLEDICGDSLENSLSAELFKST